MRGYRGSGDAVLPRPGFSDDAWLLHLHGEQTLADGVVDFVRAGVEKVLAFEINFWPVARIRKIRGQAGCELQWRRSSREIFQQVVEPGLEFWIGLCDFIGALKFQQRHHERLRNVAPAVGAEASGNCGWDSKLRNHGKIIVA